MTERYIYAVARIRALEDKLLSNAMVERLMTCPTYEQCLSVLAEKEWGAEAVNLQPEAILIREEEKIWEEVNSLNIPMERFDVVFYPKLFHNLKAAIKEVCGEEAKCCIYYDNVNISGKRMRKIVKEKEFRKLPENMRTAAEEAMETMLHTGDGQLCDVIIDRATLEAIYQIGKTAKDDIIRDYAESVVAVANIRIAVRSQKTGKTLDFMKRAMAECGTLNVGQLAKSVLRGLDGICEYLQGTAYAEGAAALEQSSAAFERWADNRIIQTLKSQKYKACTIGPIMAYVIARQMEIKTVRIILSGKYSDLSNDSIRERIREMYV